MPVLFIVGSALVGGVIAIASNSADNITEKVNTPPGGGVVNSLPLFLTIPLVIGGSIIAVKLSKKVIK